MHHSKRNEGKKGKREKTKNKKQNNSDIVTVFGEKKHLSGMDSSLAFGKEW